MKFPIKYARYVGILSAAYASCSTSAVAESTENSFQATLFEAVGVAISPTERVIGERYRTVSRRSLQGKRRDPTSIVASEVP